MSSVKRASVRPHFGKGVVNSLINKLPFELHIPGYQYCGPGTKLKKRLLRGDPGVNKLDAYAKIHDLAYEQNKDLSSRHKADYVLEQRAWERVKSQDASVGEKAAAWLVTNIMKAKQRLGMGYKNKSRPKQRRAAKNKKGNRKISFGAGLVNKVKTELRKSAGKRLVGSDMRKAAQIALRAARKVLKTSGGKKNVRIPRIISIPKVGGVLPLIPIFAGLSALGSLAGGVSGIYKALSSAKNAKQQFANKEVDSIGLEKNGNGLYLKPYKTGLGLYLNSSNSKN